MLSRGEKLIEDEIQREAMEETQFFGGNFHTMINTIPKNISTSPTILKELNLSP